MFGFLKRKKEVATENLPETTEQVEISAPATLADAPTTTPAMTTTTEESSPSSAAEIPDAPQVVTQEANVLAPTATTAEPVVKRGGFFARLTAGLKRTRANFTNAIANLVLGKKTIDDELLEELEAILLAADVGGEATAALIKELTGKVARKQLTDPQALIQNLQSLLSDILTPCSHPLPLPSPIKPYVILMVGVNGAGKTTTIGKLAHYYQQQNQKVMLAAGDTFRAAAVEQLQVWGERNQIPVIAQQAGADSAAVIYDAVQAATARKMDVLIADTAGRLHTQDHLMAELKKIKRVLGKVDAATPHEVLLILDASIGQNALVQAEQFHQAVGVTGLCITKLDGTAKGGVIFAIARKLKLPIRFIGVGESIDDLRPFVAEDFVNALFVEN